MNKEKVCIFAPVHSYDDIRIFKKEAVSLANDGYKIVLIAKSENDKVINRVKIIPAPKYKTRLQRFLLQPIYLKEILKQKPTIVHLHNPDTLLIGFILKLLNKKVVYDTHEDFSERILVREWIPPGLRNIISKVITNLEKKASQKFDRVIVTQQEILSRMDKRAVVINNAPLIKEEIVTDAEERSKSITYEKKPDYRLIYIGGISKIRGIKELIKSLELVNKKINVRLTLIGYESDDVLDEVRGYDSWKYVDYFGFLKQEDAFAHLVKADIGMATILDRGDHSKTSANKIYEYLLFNKYIICTNFKKWQDELSHLNNCSFVNPENIEELANEIVNVCTNKFGKEDFLNGKQYILEKCNWNIEEKKLLEIYHNL